MLPINVLEQADIFYGLNREQLQAIADICEVVDYDAGTVIFDENTPSEEMYVIAAGEVEIRVDPAMLGVEMSESIRPTTIATLYPGQTFGEMTLVDRGLRSASARCAMFNTKVLIIKQRDLLALCERDYELGYKLMRNVAADLALRIRSTDLLMREGVLWRPTDAPADRPFEDYPFSVDEVI